MTTDEHAREHRPLRKAKENSEFNRKMFDANLTPEEIESLKQEAKETCAYRAKRLRAPPTGEAQARNAL